jgi:hypothetical protein
VAFHWVSRIMPILRNYIVLIWFQKGRKPRERKKMDSYLNLRPEAFTNDDGQDITAIPTRQRLGARRVHRHQTRQLGKGPHGPRCQRHRRVHCRRVRVRTQPPGCIRGTQTDSLSEWYANSLKSRVTAKAAFLGPLPATRQTPHGRRIPGRRRQGRLGRFSSGTNYTT